MWINFRKNIETFTSFFKQKGLQIIYVRNLKILNYLDIIFNLNDGSYQPYWKPNSNTHYTLVHSDYPPSR